MFSYGIWFFWTKWIQDLLAKAWDEFLITKANGESLMEIYHSSHLIRKSPLLICHSRQLKKWAWLWFVPQADWERACYWCIRPLSSWDSTGSSSNKIKKTVSRFNHPEFSDTLKVWGCEVFRDPWFILTSKINKTKEALKIWISVFGHLPSIVQKTCCELLNFQDSMSNPPSLERYATERMLDKNLATASW